jgi:hypothetical protein
MLCNGRMDAPVRIEQEGPVTIVTLDRPAVRNAVDAATAGHRRGERRRGRRRHGAGAVVRSRDRLDDALEGAARFAAGAGRHGQS